MILSLLLLLLGFMVCLLLTPWVIRLALRSNIGLDAPDETRKRHDNPVPRLGGIPIICALSLGLVLILCIDPEAAYLPFSRAARLALHVRARPLG